MSATPPHLEQALVAQLSEGPQDGIRIHTQHGREVLCLGIRSPGRASPSAIALRISTATCWCNRAGSFLSTAASRRRALAVLGETF